MKQLAYARNSGLGFQQQLWGIFVNLSLIDDMMADIFIPLVKIPWYMEKRIKSEKDFPIIVINKESNESTVSFDSFLSESHYL